MSRSTRASQWAFLSVLLIGGALFVWWFRTRPSALLYRIQADAGAIDQPAVIARTQKRLQEKDLSPEEEIRFRLALAEFHLRTSFEEGTVVMGGDPDWIRVDPQTDESARAQLDRIFELDPDQPEAHYLMGRLLLKKGLSHYAVEEFEKALESRPDHIVSLIFLAQVYLDRLEPEKAREKAQQALAIRADSDEARWMLILSTLQLGQNWKAQDMYRELSPSFQSRPRIRAHVAVFLAEQNRWEESDREMNLAVASSPNDVPVRVNQARVLLMKEKGDEAAAVLKIAEAKHPRSPLLKIYLSEANARRGECAEPRQTARLLTLALPRWPYSYWPEAWAHLCEQKAEGALESLRKARELSAFYFDAVALESRLLLDMGRVERLGRLLRPWLDRRSHQSRVYAFLSESFMGQSKPDLARQMAEESIRLDSRNEDGYIGLGAARLAEKDVDGALHAFATAARLNPFSDRPIAGEAMAWAEKGEIDKAREMIEAALEKNPGSAELWVAKGMISESDATFSFRRALEIKPYLLKARLELVSALWKEGQTREAETHLVEAGRLNSKHPDVAAWRKKIKTP